MCASQLLLLSHSVFETVRPDKQTVFGPGTVVSHEKFLTPVEQLMSPWTTGYTLPYPKSNISSRQHKEMLIRRQLLFSASQTKDLALYVLYLTKYINPMRFLGCPYKLPLSLSPTQPNAYYFEIPEIPSQKGKNKISTIVWEGKATSHLSLNLIPERIQISLTSKSTYYQPSLCSDKKAGLYNFRIFLIAYPVECRGTQYRGISRIDIFKMSQNDQVWMELHPDGATVNFSSRLLENYSN